MKFKMAKNLAVFDFDHTLVNENSDEVVVELAGKEEMPNTIKNLQLTEGWTAFMQEVFTYLNKKNVTIETIKTLVADLQPVDGMLHLVKELNKRPDVDLIMISDCNSIFIKIWLEKYGIQTCFKQVFTNPSEIVNGMFKISPYHHQETCKLSTPNLCKGQILEEFIASQQMKGVTYNRIMYTGDGVNDFCPILRLKATDLVCARNKFKLLDLVTKAKKGKSLDHSGNPHTVKAEVFVWDTGADIWKHLNKL